VLQINVSLPLRLLPAVAKIRIAKLAVSAPKADAVFTKRSVVTNSTTITMVRSMKVVPVYPVRRLRTAKLTKSAPKASASKDLLPVAKRSVVTSSTTTVMEKLTKVAPILAPQ
jgi:hypothetical protein